MKKIILLSAMFLVLSVARGQDVRTANLRWVVSGLHDLQTNVNDDYICVFETSGTGNIAWKQRNGSDVSTVDVLGVDGAWVNVMSSGNVVYSISVDGRSGTLTFQRDASGVSITLELSQSEGPEVRHRYTVTSVNVN